MQLVSVELVAVDGGREGVDMELGGLVEGLPGVMQ
jgi:hypothetical protein